MWTIHFDISCALFKCTRWISRVKTKIATSLRNHHLPPFRLSIEIREKKNLSPYNCSLRRCLKQRLRHGESIVKSLSWNARRSKLISFL